MLQVEKPRLKAAKRLPTALQKISSGAGLQLRVSSFSSPVLCLVNPVVFKVCVMRLQEDISGITARTEGDSRKAGLIRIEMAALLWSVLYVWGST